MAHVAKFEKVSFDAWLLAVVGNKDIIEKIPKEEIEKLHEQWEAIKLPTRATTGSVGYDFYCPGDLAPIPPLSGVTIPTGIKCKLEPGWGLFIVPKSGLGLRYRTILSGTIGVIDSDYYNCDETEGQIFVTIDNGLYPIPRKNPITQQTELPSEQYLCLTTGMSFVQGIILPIGYAEETEPVTAVRKGGFGSTSIPDDTHGSDEARKSIILT